MYSVEKKRNIAEILGLLNEKFVENPFEEEILKDVIKTLEKRTEWHNDRETHVHVYTDIDILILMRKMIKILNYTKVDNECLEYRENIEYKYAER